MDKESIKQPTHKKQPGRLTGQPSPPFRAPAVKNIKLTRIVFLDVSDISIAKNMLTLLSSRFCPLWRTLRAAFQKLQMPILKENLNGVFKLMESQKLIVESYEGQPVCAKHRKRCPFLHGIWITGYSKMFIECKLANIQTIKPQADSWYSLLKSMKEK